MPTTTTTDRLQTEVVHFNSETVLVWEKCGIEAKTKPTKIFQTVSTTDKLTVWFDPSINSLIFDIPKYNGPNKIVHLPSSADTLFFLFHNIESEYKISIYVNCPTRSRIEYEWSFANKTNLHQENQIILYKNSLGFESLKEALATFMCKQVVVIMPGTLIHFNDLISISGSTLLFTFVTSSQTFSLSYHNSTLVLIGSNGQETIIHLTGQIHIDIGIYLVFHVNHVVIHSNCPAFVSNSLLATWNTTLFNSKLEIETFKVHQIGTVSSVALLNAFCIANSIFTNTSINENCKTLVSDLKEIDESNKLSYQFVPEPNVMQKLEALITSTNQNYGSLVEMKTRILFASRKFAKNTFFHRPIRDYELGFTDGQFNFWIGLETLAKVTNKFNYGLRIEIDYNGITYEEEYESFKVGNSSTQYVLTLGKQINKGTFYQPDATPTCGAYGNSVCSSYCRCSPFIKPIVQKPNSFIDHNGKGFSTYNYGPYSAHASRQNGGFWHNQDVNNYCFSCQSSILNDDTTTMQYNTYVSGVISSSVTRMYLLP